MPKLIARLRRAVAVAEIRTMKLAHGIIETPMATAGMLIGTALKICVDHGVPGIPFADSAGHICGRFSVRHTFLMSSISEDLILGAHLIGPDALHLDHPCEHYKVLFRQTVDARIIGDFGHLSSDAQIIKAMAMMEQQNTSYLFVIDDDSYRGVVTRLGLTRQLLEGAE